MSIPRYVLCLLSMIVKSEMGSLSKVIKETGIRED